MSDETEEYASTLDEHWPAAAAHMRKLQAKNRRLKESVDEAVQIADEALSWANILPDYELYELEQSLRKIREVLNGGQDE